MWQQVSLYREAKGQHIQGGIAPHVEKIISKSVGPGEDWQNILGEVLA